MSEFLNVTETENKTIVEFEGEVRNCLNKAKEAYGFKEIDGLLCFLLLTAKIADGNILQYEDEEGRGRLFIPVSQLVEMTPESEEIYINLINNVDLSTFTEDKHIKEIEHLSKSQKASVRYRLAAFVQQSLLKV